MLDLLTQTSRVETPFIIVTIAGVSFGLYDRSSKNSTNYDYYNGLEITYPNFMQSLTVQKVNGTINTYTINMVYAIKQGDDPNLLEKVFSKASSNRIITISYGDYSTPSFIYKEEKAIISDVKSSVNAETSVITYQITATSTALSLNAGSFDFPKLHQKPSEAILDLLYDKEHGYGLLEIFTGMIDKQKVLLKGLIASNDKVVDIEAQQRISPFARLNYLVSCMTNIRSDPLNVIQDSKYALNVVDDITGEWGGAYFKVTEILKNINTINSLDTYEINVGYPEQNLITAFTIEDNQTYSILYNYSSELNTNKYEYRINNEGDLVSIYSPVISSNDALLKTTQADKTWWTQVTQYPIRVNITMKGLLRPAILMTYVKLNVFFFGRKHLSSGTYIITRQVDTVGDYGYRTTLSLLRIQGDDEYAY